MSYMDVMCVGTLTWDVIGAFSQLAEPGRPVHIDEGIEIGIGGKAGNVAVDLVKLGLEGSKVCVVSPLGEDRWGDLLEDHLTELGITVRAHRIPGKPTAQCMGIILNGKYNQWYAMCSINHEFDLDHVIAEIGLLKPRLVVTTAASSLTRIEERLGDLLVEANRAGSSVYVDLIRFGSVSVLDRVEEALGDAIKYVDVLQSTFPLSDGKYDKEKITQTMDQLVERGVKLVLLTLGEAGIAGGTARYRFIVPSFKVAPVCPAGAGDALSASIVYNMIQRSEGNIDFDFSKEDLRNLLLEAAAAGAAAVLGVGATSNVSRKSVEEMIAGQANELRDGIINLVHPS
jgi:sugar/nucleoside kinase (ribokinase family)